ncbi:hypothetical protein SCUCBS95973_009239 [Sporothrix curviconia]|uniref:Enoyl reductase (ER) domain-containing protein n=1 Tax=Sporothrix curviconia TaxID=1260050 RepID=A0ABP0CTU9_9PEZI
MSTMKCFKLTQWGQPGEYAEAPVPSPGSNDVLVRVKAVGLCLSDVHMLHSQPGSDPFASVMDPGFILGHETAGVVESWGANVTDLRKGESVALHHVQHCGRCEFCERGLEMHCTFYKRGDIVVTRGSGLDGGLAEFVVVPRDEIVSVGDDDPVRYAPLMDAGITAYSACMKFIPRLRPGDFAVVIGIGGLGAYGIQFIKMMSAARVIAVDNLDQRLAYAKELGADFVVKSDKAAAAAIMAITKNRGIDGLVDFAGVNQTMQLAADVVRPRGFISVPGMGGGSVTLGWNKMATTAEFALSLGSSRKEMREVCQLALEGRLRIDMETFNWDQIHEAYEKLEKGQLRGRAVILVQ